MNEGSSIAISKAMIELGISGATVQGLRTLSAIKSEDNIVVPQEIIRVVVTEEQSKRVMDSIKVKSSILSHTHINQIAVTLAFNFKRPH